MSVSSLAYVLQPGHPRHALASKLLIPSFSHPTRIVTACTLALQLAMPNLRLPLFSDIRAANSSNQLCVRNTSEILFATIALTALALTHSTRLKKSVIIHKGYLGNAGKEARVGDVIVIFDGSDVPFVIRETRSDDDLRWKLVGECYLCG